MPSLYAFVTVGTTRFDALTAAALTSAFARALGVAHVRAQIGASALPLGVPEPDACSGGVARFSMDAADAITALAAAPPAPPPPRGAVLFEVFRFAPSLLPELAGAAAVVSHAGAGSIFEALRLSRPLVVVVNDALADNHQWELATAMSERGHCVACLPAELLATLRAGRWRAPAPLPDAQPGRAAFVQALDAVTGW